MIVNNKIIKPQLKLGNDEGNDIYLTIQVLKSTEIYCDCFFLLLLFKLKQGRHVFSIHGTSPIATRNYHLWLTYREQHIYI